MTAHPTPAPMSPARRAALAGILSAVGASCVFSVNDVSIKFLSGDYALHQVVLTRSLIGLAVMLAVVLPFSGGFAVLRTGKLRLHLIRGGFVVFSNLCYFLGLAAMPLADAVAIFFISPLMITALSVPMLGEKVGPRRWFAVCIGLVGVVVMLRPGSGAFQMATLLPVVSAFAYAMMHMMTRRMGGTESAVAMTFYVQLCFVQVSGAFGLAVGDGHLAAQSDASLAFLFRAWVWPAPGDWLIMLAIGVSSSFGGLLIAQAYKLCEAGLVAPFEYASMPLAIFWGVAVFGVWPDATAWMGIALICGGGLYMFWREALAARRERQEE
ncbi:DMT family transporter [Paracoccaceae bacterium Fryx2]|nr:DMT family transporter [Paracoccaceae bacterium Fryx2]